MSTGDGHASGNYALLDIVAALHWMRENVEAFGGDPHQITMLGHGHGAAIVNMLLISPVTRGMHIVFIWEVLSMKVILLDDIEFYVTCIHFLYVQVKVYSIELFYKVVPP